MLKGKRKADGLEWVSRAELLEGGPQSRGRAIWEQESRAGCWSGACQCWPYNGQPGAGNGNCSPGECSSAVRSSFLFPSHRAAALATMLRACSPCSPSRGAKGGAGPLQQPSCREAGAVVNESALIWVSFHPSIGVLSRLPSFHPSIFSPSPPLSPSPPHSCSVAIKVMSKAELSSAEDRAYMQSEVELMKRVRGHPNVVTLLDSYEDKSFFYIVAELCTGKELMDRILSETHFSEKVASSFFKQMLLALQFCHSKGVVHRDLKPENFLFASSDPAAPLKLTDFGLAASISSPDEELTEPMGSAYYIAPEIFTKRYTKAVDVWSLGVILFLMLSGNVPFGQNAETEKEVYKCIQREDLVFDAKQWLGISPLAKQLLTGLLEKDPFKRYTIEQALSHAWVLGESVADVALDRNLLQSMMNFNAKNKFKRAALKLVASSLTSADVQTLRAAFHKIDTDNTGFLTMDEMRQAMMEMGMDATSVQELVINMDQDGDNRISWNEFLEATMERIGVQQQTNMWWAFCEYDKDGDGVITLAELKEVLKGEPLDQIEKYIKEFDTDGDGTINYEEFMRMLLPKDMKYQISKF